MDFTVPWHNYPYLSGGLEYSYSRFLIFRGGTRYNYDELNSFFREFFLSEDVQEQKSINDLKLAAGFTFKHGQIHLDYAWQYMVLLGSVNMITLSFGY